MPAMLLAVIMACTIARESVATAADPMALYNKKAHHLYLSGNPTLFYS
jgi:hypothetical protein